MFSSSKETDTLRRTGFDPAMMEILQVLNYSLKQGMRESTFTGVHANAREAEMLFDPLKTAGEASGMSHSGNFDDFLTLVHQSHGEHTV